MKLKKGGILSPIPPRNSGRDFPRCRFSPAFSVSDPTASAPRRDPILLTSKTAAGGIKAQRRVALFQQARSFEQTIAVIESLLLAMLCNHQSALVKQPGSGAAQQAQRSRIFLRRIPGRTQKNSSVAFSFPSRMPFAQNRPHGDSINMESRRDPQPLQVAAQNLERHR